MYMLCLSLPKPSSKENSALLSTHKLALYVDQIDSPLTHQTLRVSVCGILPILGSVPNGAGTMV